MLLVEEKEQDDFRIGLPLRSKQGHDGELQFKLRPLRSSRSSCHGRDLVGCQTQTIKGTGRLSVLAVASDQIMTAINGEGSP